MSEEKDKNLAGRIPQIDLPANFTDRVMGRIEMDQREITEYKILKTNNLVYLIITVLALLFIYFIRPADPGPGYLHHMFSSFDLRLEFPSAKLFSLGLLALFICLAIERLYNRFSESHRTSG